jgi:hypothetical protein
LNNLDLQKGELKYINPVHINKYFGDTLVRGSVVYKPKPTKKLSYMDAIKQRAKQTKEEYLKRHSK